MGARLTVTTDPTGEFRRGMERFKRNARFAEEHFHEYLERYPGQWLVVYGEQQVLTGRSLEDLPDCVPEEHQDTAVLRYLERPCGPMIL